MESEQLQELATNAELNHWPPHLGVKTDAEKIEYLAQRLREASDVADNRDDLVRQLETAETERDLLESEVNELKHKLDKIRELTT